MNSRVVAIGLAGLAAGGLIAYALNKREANRAAATVITEPACEPVTVAAATLTPPAVAFTTSRPMGPEAVSRGLVRRSLDYVGVRTGLAFLLASVRLALALLAAVVSVPRATLTYPGFTTDLWRVPAILPPVERLTIRAVPVLVWLRTCLPVRGPNAVLLPRYQSAVSAGCAM